MVVINGETRTLGLIGKPVEHTLSPVIHNYLADKMKINAVYVPLLVEDNLDAAVKGAYALNLLGMNVTVPYKTDVISKLSEIDPLAEKIGAVNTLVRADGGYCGYNTDALGLKQELIAEKVQVEGKPVVVLGAGGVACAVVHLLAEMKASEIILLNRSVEKAEVLCGQVNRSVGSTIAKAGGLDDYKTLMTERNYIAIQCTSVGLAPQTESCVLKDVDFFRKISVGVDLIYNPEETKFMKNVRECGGRAYNGLKMLLYQGVTAFELFTGTKVPEKTTLEAYELLKKALKEKRG